MARGKKVSKNQRTNRGNKDVKQMAKIMVPYTTPNGSVGYKSKLVEASTVESALQNASESGTP